MKRALLAAVLAVSSPLAAQSQRIERPPSPPVTVQLDAMPLGALATMLMRDVMRVPYVISADVLNDHRPVSVNLVMRRNELPVRVVRFLRSQGLTVWIEGGTVYVSKGDKQAGNFGPAAMPSGSPLAPSPVAAPINYGGPSPADPPPKVEPVEPRQLAVIRPAHRSVAEIAGALSSVLPGLDVAARGSSEPQGTGIAGAFEPDALTIGGSADDVEMAVALARSLDKPRPQVEIRAVVFEVRNTDARSSALSLLAKVAGVELETGFGTPGENFVRIAASGVSAVFSATRTDGRFKVVAEPTLAALSGSTATINAGSQVPTLGSVTYTEGGAPIRSVVYRDSGISLSVKPLVRAGEIELTVQQERSSFGRTNTGVDDSPTLNRAAASAQVALRPGEAVMLAGLDEKSESDGRQGFLGGLLKSRSRDNSASQLVLLLQADIAPERPAEPLTVEFITEPTGGNS